MNFWIWMAILAVGVGVVLAMTAVTIYFVHKK